MCKLYNKLYSYTCRPLSVWQKFSHDAYCICTCTCTRTDCTNSTFRPWIAWQVRIFPWYILRMYLYLYTHILYTASAKAVTINWMCCICTCTEYTAQSLPVDPWSAWRAWIFSWCAWSWRRRRSSSRQRNFHSPPAPKKVIFFHFYFSLFSKCCSYRVFLK